MIKLLKGKGERMGKYLIVCASKNGSTDQYSKWLAETIDADVVDYKKVKARHLNDYEGVIYGGAVRIGRILGFIKFKEKCLKDSSKLIALFAVGMNNAETSYENFLKKKNNIDVPFFYMQGRFELQTLKNKTERTILRRVCHNLMLRSDLHEEEKFLVHCALNPFDNVNPINLLPIIKMLNCGGEDKLAKIYYSPKVYEKSI